MSRIDGRRRRRGRRARAERSAPCRWPRRAAAICLIGLAAGCAGMPPPPPPAAPLPSDAYSGGSNFGGPPMYFGPQE